MKKIGLILSLSFIFIILFIINTYSIIIDKDLAVVLKNNITLKEKQDDKSKTVLTLNMGDDCVILEKSKKRYIYMEDTKKYEESDYGYYWFRVKTHKNIVGWVFGINIAINPDSKFIEWITGISEELKEKVEKHKKLSLKGDFDGDGKDDIFWFAITNDGQELGMTIIVTNTNGKHFLLSDTDKNLLFGTNFVIRNVGQEMNVESVKTIKDKTGKKLLLVLEINTDGDNGLGGLAGHYTFTIGLEKDKLVIIERKKRKEE